MSEDGVEVALLPGGKGRLVAVSHGGTQPDLPPVDVVFPVLHGPFGEDGSVQGYAEVADVAYVGCGILASAAAMDKDVAKRLMREAGLAVARSVTLHRDDVGSFQEIAGALGLPFFAKPARQGSSFGVSKVNDRDGFEQAVETAFRYDGKALIEEFVDGREIECSVLQRADGTLTVSLPGEIIPAGKHGFYTYEAKYLDADGAVVKVPADVPSVVADRAQGDGAAGFPGARLRSHGARRFLPARRRQPAGQRGQHHPGLHRYLDVRQGAGGIRHRLRPGHRRADRARAGKAWGANSLRSGRPTFSC